MGVRTDVCGGGGRYGGVDMAPAGLKPRTGVIVRGGVGREKGGRACVRLILCTKCQ